MGFTVTDQQRTEGLCTYAALILADDGAEVSAENIQKLVSAAGGKVAPFWPKLFAGILADSSLSEVLAKAGKTGSYLSDGGDAGPAAAGGAKAAAVEEEEEEEEEAADDDEEEEEEDGEEEEEEEDDANYTSSYINQFRDRRMYVPPPTGQPLYFFDTGAPVQQGPDRNVRLGYDGNPLPRERPLSSAGRQMAGGGGGGLQGFDQSNAACAPAFGPGVSFAAPNQKYHIPGYAGFVRGMQFRHGDTYAKVTRKCNDVPADLLLEP